MPGPQGFLRPSVIVWLIWLPPARGKAGGAGTAWRSATPLGGSLSHSRAHGPAPGPGHALVPGLDKLPSLRQKGSREPRGPAQALPLTSHMTGMEQLALQPRFLTCATKGSDITTCKVPPAQTPFCPMLAAGGRGTGRAAWWLRGRLQAERHRGDRAQGDGSDEVGMRDGGWRTNSGNSVLSKRFWLCSRELGGLSRQWGGLDQPSRFLSHRTTGPDSFLPIPMC